MAGNGYGNPYGGGGNPYGGGGNPYGGGGNPFGGGGNPYGGGGNPFGGGQNPFGGGGNGGYPPVQPPKNFSTSRVEKNFGIIILLFSVLAGLIAFGAGEVIYRMGIDASNPNSNSVIFMGVYFCAAGLIIAIMLFIAARISRITFSVTGLIFALIMSLVLLPAGSAFEYLYEKEMELTPQTVQVNTLGNCIFLLDESGSMGTNDKSKQRITAVQNLLNNAGSDTQYAVYAFANKCEMVRSTTTVGNGVYVSTENANVGGGTEIYGAIETVIADIETGALNIENPQLILLTDGDDYAPSNGDSILDRYISRGIKISTIGFGTADKSMLYHISSYTGGKNVMANNANELGDAFESVTDQNALAPRNLLSRRNMTGDGIYALMRIAFIALLGVIIMLVKIGMVGQSSNKLLPILTSTGCSILAGVLLEFGLKFFMSEMVGRLITMLLLSLTIVMVQTVRLNLFGGGPTAGIKDY